MSALLSHPIALVVAAAWFGYGLWTLFSARRARPACECPPIVRQDGTGRRAAWHHHACPHHRTT